MAKSDEFIEKLAIYATNYLRECMSHTKEVVSGSGKVVEVMDRHIPTIDYFLNIWIPLLQLEKIGRTTYYEWLKGDDEIKANTIKRINDDFKALAKDIVANEGKGIFYAKNALGMHDRQQLETKTVDKFEFD
tara:strand:- start:32392 stop:32787 length:396 start_codon:yes stop_codon:yes gene_type:complete